MRRPVVPGRARQQRGMTLVELMVGVVLSMVLALAVFTVMAQSEGRKRTTTAGNDINQTGNYTLYLLDKLVRGAGSGLAEAADYALGCKLLAAKGNSVVLPRTQPLPAPFAAVNTGTANTFRLAPVLIGHGQTKAAVSDKASDVLIVMASTSGLASVPVKFSGKVEGGELPLDNTMGVVPGDLLLLVDEQPSEATGGPVDCLVQQVGTNAAVGASKSLVLGGPFNAGEVNGTAAKTYREGSALALPLGNAAAGAPAFQVIGVGEHNTLYSYDLLQTTASPLAPIADGVFEMHALYGVDTNGDLVIDRWVAPDEGSGYGLATLMDGSPTATGLLKQIRAVRVGLIMRTSLPEKEAVSQGIPTLFADLDSSLHYERKLETDDEKRYRYRTFETTIPVRNTLLK
jgi:type IV pilus assembly protein PilW